METELIIAVASLAALLVTLDVDNVVFVAILTNDLPAAEQKKARLYGLLAGIAMRAVMLTFVGALLGYLQDPILPAIPFLTPETHTGAGPVGYTLKDIIMMVGGMFLLYKATKEIHHKLEGEDLDADAVGKTVRQVVTQILLVDLIFSIDGVITAVGMTQQIPVMITAMLLSSTLMFFLLGPISNFVSKHPTIKVLSLAFLLLIGMTLFVEGLHIHLPKGYVYFSMAFSLGVEVLNINIGKKGKPVELHGVKKITDTKSS